MIILKYKEVKDFIFKQS